MEMCCPDPEKPAIVPDRESLRLRRHLRYVFYGQAGMCLVKGLLQGLVAGLFQLFSVWIAFSSWASMHHCTLVFQLVYVCLDLLMLLGGWPFLAARAAQLGLLFEPLPYLMAGFYVYALVASWKAYKRFKEEYARQYLGPEAHGGYQLFSSQGIRGMSRYDDPERQGARSYQYSGPPRATLPQRAQGGFAAFQGQGVRLG